MLIRFDGRTAIVARAACGIGQSIAHALASDGARSEIEIQAVHDGTADSILIGIRGLVGQMQREDGAKKVRRGMAGVVRDGRHAGGRAYGYRAVPGKPGELEIVEDEAAIVRRIFAAYGAGRTRGRQWNASTINGNAQRGA